MFRSSLIQPTSAGTSEHDQLRSCRRPATRAAIAFAVSLLCPAAVMGQEISGPCAKDVKESGAFVHCVAGAVSSEAMNRNPGTLLTEPLHGYLRKLEAMLGYTGDPADVGLLKQVSLDLKQDPATNREAIGLLDNAIASHAAELRPAMSRETAAIGIDDGTDIYPRFVEQRLKFLLDPDKVKFYERGPFEIPIRASLANTLEAKYFSAKGDRDDNLLRQEIRALKDVRKMTLALPAREPRRRLRLNGNLFWQASIFFALGDKEQFSHALHELVDENRDFGLESMETGHVYIYKVFDLPFSITVEGVDPDGKPVLTADDPHILNRFYNPGQLALSVCDLIKAAGQNGVQGLSDAIRDLAFNDFYVVVASGSNPDMLRQFGDAVMKSIAEGEHASRRDLLLQEIGKNAAQLSHKMENGAAACGVEQEVRDKIYPPFDFKFEVRHIETLGKHTQHLMLGGSLNADQANKLAEFFNRAVFADSTMRDQALKLGVESVSYTARVRIE
jgi:hypothetical protein